MRGEYGVSGMEGDLGEAVMEKAECVIGCPRNDS